MSIERTEKEVNPAPTSDGLRMEYASQDYSFSAVPSSADIYFNYNHGLMESLNRPLSYNVPELNQDEQNSAKRIQELMVSSNNELKVKSILELLDGPSARNHAELKEIFGKMDSQTANKIMAALNPDLARENLVLARAHNGDIWAGRRETADKPFFISTLLQGNGAPKLPSVFEKHNYRKH